MVADVEENPRGTRVFKTRVSLLISPSVLAPVFFFVRSFFVLGFFFFMFILFFFYWASSSFCSRCLIFDWFGQQLANPRPTQSTTSLLRLGVFFFFLDMLFLFVFFFFFWFLKKISCSLLCWISSSLFY